MGIMVKCDTQVILQDKQEQVSNLRVNVSNQANLYKFVYVNRNSICYFYYVNFYAILGTQYKEIK